MKKEEISLLDFYRIFHGQLPLEFYFELVGRAIFVFVLITLGMKYLGKRVSSQITRSELAATSTLAAATGLVILAPDRGLVPPIIIVAILIIIQRFIHKRAMKSDRFAHATEGHLSLLVENGILLIEPMKSSRITRHELFGRLRSQGVMQLGEVSRMYLEADGEFTVVKMDPSLPGLSVLPEWDKEFIAEQDRSDKQVCNNCGDARPASGSCDNCGMNEWQESFT